MDNVETSNIVKAGAPDYGMGFEQIRNMTWSSLTPVDDNGDLYRSSVSKFFSTEMIDLSLEEVGVRRDDRVYSVLRIIRQARHPLINPWRTLENCYQLDALVSLPPNKSSAADLISRSS